MPAPALVKPTHKAIVAYYAALKAYRDRKVTHEGALETAFQRLLEDTAKSHGWKLIPKQKLKVGKHTLFPDGTLRDLFNMRCGFWEAKDTHDDLQAEIQKKIDKGYPLTNTIFEDTQQAVLFQGGQRRHQFDLTDKQQLATLLNEFYAYTEPEIDSFHQAVEEFKTRVPDLARNLLKIIAKAHENNKKFQTAFDDFFTLCQNALNPNISRAAVDEMLVQHLLTERLIRKIFDNPDFTHRNVIAVELEKVIDALVSLAFNRDGFLKSLDVFYRAIEEAAHGLEDFSEKQHFLNTVYERFFQGYSVKVADTHGIVYTPQEIVDFMCASVEEVLKTEFGLSLSSPSVYIIDPCTGTGNFIVNLINRMPSKDLPRMYKEQLFANEVMLLPYYIAALNIEHAYFERTGTYEPFEGLCFVDTLDLAEQKNTLSMMTAKNAERVERQKKAPITVVIGNPPYNVGQLDENDNNKNRKYPEIEKSIRATYAKDSAATLKTQLYDPYVKFIRWATLRLGEEGILCFVTNNSFVDQIAFDGMRKHLMKDFTQIYHVHLEGNVRHNPKLAGTTYNVFGIQVGVGITVAIRSKRHKVRQLLFHRIDKDLRREAKLAWLAKHEKVSGVQWQTLKPDERSTWLTSEHGDEFATLTPIGTKAAKAARGPTATAIFKMYSGGVKTNRDDVVYDFQKSHLCERMSQFVEHYNAEVDRFKRSKQPVKIDDFVRYQHIKWDGTLKSRLLEGKYGEFVEGAVRNALYRPFSKRLLYFDRLFLNSVYLQQYFFPNLDSENENVVIGLTDLGSEKPFMLMPARSITDLHLVGAGCGTQCFPFYTYDEDGTNRRENITDWALQQFREHYGDPTISKWDIFHYVYGVLHHPGYRAKFADNLKRELPRIPFAPPLPLTDVRGSENPSAAEPRTLVIGETGERPDANDPARTSDMPLTNVRGSARPHGSASARASASGASSEAAEPRTLQHFSKISVTGL